ncbi:MAG: endolytic transglycosylase MltG [Cellulomonadaceae bacterium]
MNDLFHHAEERPHGAHVATDSRASRRGGADARRRRRHRRLRSASVILLTLALVAGGLYLARDVLTGLFGSDGDTATVTDYPGPGTGQVEVVIPQGASGAAIGQALVDSGVVATQKAFTDAIAEYTREYGAPTLQYGTYTLLREMRAADALLAMLDSANLTQNGVTIREGLTVSETVERLSSVTTIPVADFEAALADPASIGLPEEAGGDAEGWLAAATYPYDDSTTATDLLSAMVTRQVSDLTDLGVAEADRETVLIKASLVEKEAPADARAEVARVIENRLAKGQRLELDSTVHFLFGASDDASTTSEQRATESPYNTYLNTGLPPGPIASPGRAAIAAVLNPAEGDWLFFVTVNPLTGETKFATTYAEHQENVAEYQQWLRDNQTAEPTDDPAEDSGDEEGGE